MDIKGQLKIISSYQKGIPVFYNSKYSDDEYRWKKVTSDHQFNFDSNAYCVGEPLSFEAALVQDPPELAFHKAISYLSKKEPLFRINVTDTNKETGQIVDEFSAVRFNDLYKIWNIAVQYGSKSVNISPLTEEQGKFKY